MWQISRDRVRECDGNHHTLTLLVLFDVVLSMQAEENKKCLYLSFR